MTPTFTLAGTFTDDRPGVVVTWGPPYFVQGTATTSPFSFPDIPLSPGHNYFELTIKDAQDEADVIGISVYRVAETNQTFVFAEGNTSGFFNTDLLFSNPNGGEVPVTIDFAREDGTVITHGLTLPALRRTTLSIDSIPGLEAATMATVVRTLLVPHRRRADDALGRGRLRGVDREGGNSTEPHVVLRGRLARLLFHVPAARQSAGDRERGDGAIPA